MSRTTPFPFADHIPADLDPALREKVTTLILWYEESLANSDKADDVSGMWLYTGEYESFGNALGVILGVTEAQFAAHRVGVPPVRLPEIDHHQFVAGPDAGPDAGCEYRDEPGDFPCGYTRDDHMAHSPEAFAAAAVRRLRDAEMALDRYRAFIRHGIDQGLIPDDDARNGIADLAAVENLHGAELYNAAPAACPTGDEVFAALILANARLHDSGAAEQVARVQREAARGLAARFGIEAAS